jgi:hypothetical protein
MSTIGMWPVGSRPVPISPTDAGRLLLMSERQVIANQKQILKNQKTIISNQGHIKGNQETIKRNQAAILKNQSSLGTIIRNQKQILAAIKK